MTKIYEGIVNGWYYCVEDTGRTDTQQYWAHVHDVMSVNRLRNFESQDDALLLLSNWRIENGVLIEKATAERFGYFATADAAQAVARRACQMRGYNLVSAIREIGRFLEKFGMQGHLQN